MTAGLLRKFSVTYLFLPNLLFVVGWFTPVVGYTVAAGLCYLLFLEWKKTDESPKLSLKDVCWIVLFSCVCLFFSGIDGLTTQSRDWIAHNQKYFDLFQQNWPIYFPEVGQYACYYFGYFLVPSFLSKIYGGLLPSFLITWSLLGYALGLSWIYLLLHRNLLALIVLFFLRGAGHAVFVALHALKLVDWLPSNLTPSVRDLLFLLRYSPNQLIPALIVTGIILFDFLQKRRLESSFFVLTLIFTWAVFPAISLLLIYVSLLGYQYIKQQLVPKFEINYLIITLLIPVILLLPTLLYFQSSQSISSDFLLWNTPDKKRLVLGYLTSMFVDLVVLYIILSRLNKIYNEAPQYLINILITGLFLISLFKIGKYNDLFFRGSMPFGIIIFVLMLRMLINVFKAKQWRFIYPTLPFLLLLVLFSCTGLLVNRRLLRDNIIANHFLGSRPIYQKFAYGQYPNMYQAIRYGSGEEVAWNQYLVKKDSWYEKYLCKKQGNTP